MTSKSPLLPTPFVQFMSVLNPNSCQAQPHTLCAKIERRLTDCFEAYGYGSRGTQKCRDLVYDYQECRYSTFQFFRYNAIRKERMKQYREGKIDRPFDEHPPLDGLIYYSSN